MATIHALLIANEMRAKATFSARYFSSSNIFFDGLVKRRHEAPDVKTACFMPRTLPAPMTNRRLAPCQCIGSFGKVIVKLPVLMCVYVRCRFDLDFMFLFPSISKFNTAYRNSKCVFLPILSDYELSSLYCGTKF